MAATKIPSLVLILGLGVSLTGCHGDMWRQDKMDSFTENELFRDNQGARPLVDGTVPRGNPKSDTVLHTGYENGKLVTRIPIKVDKATLLRGQERFDIACSHCHGKLGYGDGMITQRGLALKRKPASYHSDRLRGMPIGHFFDVMSNGYGVMFAQNTRVTVEDRWAIAAYIRALQTSQNYDASKLSAEERAKVDAAPNKEEAPAEGH